MVLVKDGSSPQIAIVFSIDKSGGSDCDGWLGDLESGALVPPPDLAP